MDNGRTWAGKGVMGSSANLRDAEVCFHDSIVRDSRINVALKMRRSSRWV